MSAALRLALLAAVLASCLPAAAHAAGAFVPNDIGAGNRAGGWQRLQWNFAGPYGVRAPRAWANLIRAGRPGGAGVTVAVLDAGVAYGDHGSPDLSTARFVPGWDFVDGDPEPFDVDGHGTFVASTIAQTTDNRYGLTGLAYGARILPVRVLDSNGDGTVSDIAGGIRFAAGHGAKIINLSLAFDPGVAARDIPELLAAINEAHRRGSLVVAAAGNDGLAPVSYPARAPYVVSVGGTTEHGCLSASSDAGEGLDLVAPGGDRDAPFPDDPRCRPAEAARDLVQVTPDARFRSGFGIATSYHGTSFAAPHVSATAALVVASGILGRDPSPAALERHLERTARDLGRPGRDARYGWGLVDAAAATARGS